MAQDGGTGGRPREHAQQPFEQTLEVARTPAHAEGGWGVLLISLVALILSGLSLYETNLKQARLVLHVGAVMYEARDAEGVEVFAVPVTITNHGARDAVVTAIDLAVLTGRDGAGATPFAGAYVGAGGASAIKDKQPFTPLSLPGRGAYTGLVLFQPSDLSAPGPHLRPGGGDTLRFCVAMRVETSQDYPLLEALLPTMSSITSFNADLPWFAAKALDAGQAVSLQIKDVKRDDVRELRAASGCS
jgi:hypothetical protein